MLKESRNFPYSNVRQIKKYKSESVKKSESKFYKYYNLYDLNEVLKII